MIVNSGSVPRYWISGKPIQFQRQ